MAAFIFKNDLIFKKFWQALEKWFLNARYKLSKAKEFLGLGFSRETAETLGNLGLKPKLGFQSTAAPVNVPYGNFITRLEYKGFTVFRGSKKQVEALAEKLKNMGDEAAVKYLDDLLEKVFLISKKFEEHIVQGHVKIEIVNAQLPKKILINGIEQNNASRILEEYEYLLGNGRAKTTIKPPYQAKIKSKGGMHVLDNFNKKLIQIYEHVSVEFLPTGEKVLISKIKYWVEELGEFVTKKDKHTFFPKEWDISKIKKVVQEASENITFRQGNKYRGITKQGIEIEFYIDAKSREITTAYIYFK